ncbi:response regulator transcription factor [Tundrisphaera sp. TA3]|uniref:response regulator transcription factor n=1 Tax=Tundrisphaera sp. TA3 TaxID=3435775 RepID=UPI003EB6C933
MDRRGSLLIVEDEDILRMLVSQFLRAEGYRICEAADGVEGVEKFAEEGPFDLCLVDLNLPRLSGVEVCRQIREAAPSQKILICSAAIVPRHETELRSIGVNQMMTKPYHPDDLVANIRREIDPGPGSPMMTPIPLMTPVGVI